MRYIVHCLTILKASFEKWESSANCIRKGGRETEFTARQEQQTSSRNAQGTNCTGARQKFDLWVVGSSTVT